MKVAIGLKAHSGWGVLVVVGLDDGEYHILDRRRIELIEEKDATWAKQPYHAAEGLEADAASAVITLGIAEAQAQSHFARCERHYVGRRSWVTKLWPPRSRTRSHA